MPSEIRIFRSSPFDPNAQELLVPPKARTRPDLTDLTGPNAFFYLAVLRDAPQGCIALRNMGSFGLVSAFRFLSDRARTSLPDILIEQVETQARSLRLPVLRAWVERMYPVQGQALRRNGYFPVDPKTEEEDMTLYERPLRRAATSPERRQSEPSQPEPPDLRTRTKGS